MVVCTYDAYSVLNPNYHLDLTGTLRRTLHRSNNMSNTDEEKILDLLGGIQLDQFYRQIVDKLHVTRFNHFDHVTEEDLDDLGMSKPEQRRLFEALKKARKKTLFGSFRRKKSKNKLLPSESEGDQSTTSAPTPTSSAPTPATSSLTCLINEKAISLYEMIGKGAFGFVRKGEWISDSKQKIDVAVKCLKESRDAAFLQMQMDFIKEANAMSLLDHPHIIKLYGVVLSTPLMLVTELAPLGCLLTCLRNNKPKFLISQLCDFVIQVASGMAYLESQHYIHRDLAARNLLLSSYDTVKIGDFGLMRPLSIEEDYYTMNPKGKVPFAWCPPESLRFRKFSHASDVWAFGITVTELFSYGAEPWPGLNGGQILQKVDLPQSERPQKPSHCPSKIYNILFTYCWAHDPANRPKFSALQNIFETIRPQDARAILSYDSKSPQNLCFEEGDFITVIESSSESSWWRGQNKKTGRVGMFPCELIEGGRSSGSSSPKSANDGPATRKNALSPNCSSTRTKRCDCGEKHIYDFPVLLNLPTPTSPDGTRNSVRSFDSELIFNAENDSGYSSSADRFHRSNSDCSQDLQKDFNFSYENCTPSSYELMELGIPIPSRPVPIPDKGRGSPHAVLSDPVSIPVRPNNQGRLSDPNPTPKRGFSKGRVSDPEPERPSGPFSLSRQVSAKKLNSFSVPTKNAESVRCPLDFRNSKAKSPKRNSGVESSPPPLPPKKAGTSRPHSRNSNSSTSPDKSPVLLQESGSRKESIGESFANEMMNFIRSVSSDGFDSETLKEAQQAMRKPSPSEDIPSGNVGVTVRPNSVGGKTQCARPNTAVTSPSKDIPNGEIGVTERSKSVGGTSRAKRDRSKTENHEHVPRSKSVGSRTFDYENHAVAAKQESFQSYDNSKLKYVATTKERNPFYENHVVSPVAAENKTGSASFGAEASGGNVKLEETRHLAKEDSKSSSRKDVCYENYSPLKSVPQNYEKMVLRKSFIENESVTDKLTATEKEVGIGDEIATYENCAIGSKNSQPFYENFVLVEHSDIPEDIFSDSGDLKCPSYENRGFCELETFGKEALKEETEARPPQTSLDSSAILSKSLPTLCDWKLVRESVNDDRSLSVLVEVHGTPNLRKTSSDGDVSESKQNKKTGSRPESDDTSGPIPPPRWKKRAKEAKKAQTRWSLNVTGNLATVLSDYFNQHNRSIKDVKNEPTPVENADKPTPSLREEEEHVNLSEIEDLEKTSEIPSQPSCEKTVTSQGDVIQRIVSQPSLAKKFPTPENTLNGIALEQQVHSKPLPVKEEVNLHKDSSSPVSLDSRTSKESPIPALGELTNGIDDVSSTEVQEKPQRPNVLCFENKLAGFAEMFHSQVNTNGPKNKEVLENVPALPPKVKSSPSIPGRRNTSKSSQYPRLSRDSTDAKLSFAKDGQRYRPCPTNSGLDKIYDIPHKDVHDNAPPPLPLKVSKTKSAPDVPPRPDLSCP